MQRRKIDEGPLVACIRCSEEMNTTELELHSCKKKQTRSVITDYYIAKQIYLLRASRVISSENGVTAFDRG